MGVGSVLLTELGGLIRLDTNHGVGEFYRTMLLYALKVHGSDGMLGASPFAGLAQVPQGEAYAMFGYLNVYERRKDRIMDEVLAADLVDLFLRLLLYDGGRLFGQIEQQVLCSLPVTAKGNRKL